MTIARGCTEEIVIEGAEPTEPVMLDRDDLADYYRSINLPVQNIDNAASSALRTFISSYTRGKIRSGDHPEAPTCSVCHKRPRECRCTTGGRYEYMRVSKSWLLSLTAEDLSRVHPINRERILGWIEYLKSQPDG